MVGMQMEVERNGEDVDEKQGCCGPAVPVSQPLVRVRLASRYRCVRDGDARLAVLFIV